MSEQANIEPPPEPVPSSGDQAHEHVVEHVRDVTMHGIVFIGTRAGTDAAARQVAPFTYDIPVDHAEAIETSQEYE